MQMMAFHMYYFINYYEQIGCSEVRIDLGFNQLPFLWTAIFPIAVLLYYFFRKKYSKQSVSSTLFWEEVMKETKASPYLQHLQRNALFYLQMISHDFTCSCFASTILENKSACWGTNCVYRRYLCYNGSKCIMILHFLINIRKNA